MVVIPTLPVVSGGLITSEVKRGQGRSRWPEQRAGGKPVRRSWRGERAPTGLAPGKLRLCPELTGHLSRRRHRTGSGHPAFGGDAGQWGAALRGGRRGGWRGGRHQDRSPHLGRAEWRPATAAAAQSTADGRSAKFHCLGHIFTTGNNERQASCSGRPCAACACAYTCTNTDVTRSLCVLSGGVCRACVCRLGPRVCTSFHVLVCLCEEHV